MEAAPIAAVQLQLIPIVDLCTLLAPQPRQPCTAVCMQAACGRGIRAICSGHNANNRLIPKRNPVPIPAANTPVLLQFVCLDFSKRLSRSALATRRCAVNALVSWGRSIMSWHTRNRITTKFCFTHPRAGASSGHCWLYNVEYMLHSPGGKIPGPPVLAKLEVKAVAAANFHVSQRQFFTR